jgi:hypothetical protein
MTAMRRVADAQEVLGSNLRSTSARVRTPAKRLNTELSRFVRIDLQAYYSPVRLGGSECPRSLASKLLSSASIMK